MSKDRASDEALAEFFDMTVDELYESALNDGKILNHQTCAGTWQKYAVYEEVPVQIDVACIGSDRISSYYGGQQKQLRKTPWSDWIFNRDPDE